MHSRRISRVHRIIRIATDEVAANEMHRTSSCPNLHHSPDGQMKRPAEEFQRSLVDVRIHVTCPNVIRGRLSAHVDDLRVDRAMMVIPALSARHHCEAFERTAGPVVTLVEMLTARDRQRFATYRTECERLVAEYLQDNVLRQGYLMARATKAR